MIIPGCATIQPSRLLRASKENFLSLLLSSTRTKYANEWDSRAANDDDGGGKEKKRQKNLTKRNEKCKLKNLLHLSFVFPPPPVGKTEKIRCREPRRVYLPSPDSSLDICYTNDLWRVCNSLSRIIFQINRIRDWNWLVQWMSLMFVWCCTIHEMRGHMSRDVWTLSAS